MTKLPLALLAALCLAPGPAAAMGKLVSAPEAAGVDRRVVKALFEELAAAPMDGGGVHRVKKTVPAADGNPMSGRVIGMGLTELGLPAEGPFQHAVIKRAFQGYLWAQDLVQQAAADGSVTQRSTTYLIALDGRLLSVERTSVTGIPTEKGMAIKSRPVEERLAPAEQAGAWAELSRELLLAGPAISL